MIPSLWVEVGSRWKCWPIFLQLFKVPTQKEKACSPSLSELWRKAKNVSLSPLVRWGCLRTLASPNIVFKNKLFILQSPSSPRSSGSFGKVNISSYESLSQHIGRHLYMSFIPAFCKAAELQGEKAEWDCHAKTVPLFSVNVYVSFCVNYFIYWIEKVVCCHCRTPLPAKEKDSEMSFPNFQLFRILSVLLPATAWSCVCLFCTPKVPIFQVERNISSLSISTTLIKWCL